MHTSFTRHLHLSESKATIKPDMASQSSIIMAYFIAICFSLSSIEMALASRNLLQTTLPPLPLMPTLPQLGNMPPLPSLPQPSIPNIPKIPTVPQFSLPPLPATNALPNLPMPTIPTNFPSISFLSPPPSTTTSP
ncbi:hypothetical protein VNO78_11565 [Psophocarpus tetragonolobus]|uniref:RNA-binding protein 12-like n=1 Tax=Psophocarpus tetragonolobus TaxID=3891 RepID=A0AAN9XNR0_PSOTE